MGDDLFKSYEVWIAEERERDPEGVGECLGAGRCGGCGEPADELDRGYCRTCLMERYAAVSTVHEIAFAAVHGVIRTVLEMGAEVETVTAAAAVAVDPDSRWTPPSHYGNRNEADRVLDLVGAMVEAPTD